MTKIFFCLIIFIKDFLTFYEERKGGTFKAKQRAGLDVPVKFKSFNKKLPASESACRLSHSNYGDVSSVLWEFVKYFGFHWSPYQSAAGRWWGEESMYHCGFVTQFIRNQPSTWLGWNLNVNFRSGPSRPAPAGSRGRVGRGRAVWNFPGEFREVAEVW